MKTFSEETRRKMSEAAKLRCTPEWREAKSKASAVDVDAGVVRRLYESGLTQPEVAEQLGVTRKIIERVMRQNSIPARKAAKRDQWGEKNHQWRGDDASLSKLHRRLDRRFGTPQRCEVCGTTDPDKTYDWANLSGNYADLTDFKRMCRSCHWRYDDKAKNFQGKRDA